jgi:pre-mRNA-processing factor 19
MATRRKRPVPKDWISPAEVEELAPKKPDWSSTVKKFGPCSALARGLHEDSESIVYASEDGTAVFHQSGTAGSPFEINCGSRITDAVCWEDKAVFALASGQVKVYEGSREVGAFAVHAGAVTGLALHPCGSLLASVGADRSYVLYDLENPKKSQPAARVFTDSGTYFAATFAHKLTTPRTDVLPIPPGRTPHRARRRGQGD